MWSLTSRSDSSATNLISFSLLSNHGPYPSDYDDDPDDQEEVEAWRASLRKAALAALNPAKLHRLALEFGWHDMLAVLQGCNELRSLSIVCVYPGEGEGADLGADLCLPQLAALELPRCDDALLPHLLAAAPNLHSLELHSHNLIRAAFPPHDSITELKLTPRADSLSHLPAFLPSFPSLARLQINLDSENPTDPATMFAVFPATLTHLTLFANLDTAVGIELEAFPALMSYVALWRPDGNSFDFSVEGEALWSPLSDAHVRSYCSRGAL